MMEKEIAGARKIAGAREIAGAKKIVSQAWEYVSRDIGAPPGAVQEGGTFLSRLHRALDEAFSIVMKQAESGQIDPFADLVSTKHGPEIGEVELHKIDRPIRVGFLALASNPLWWGHILVALMSQGHLALDTVVFRVQGHIEYKNVADKDRVPVQARHEITKEVLGPFYPLFRYTDLGSEPGNRREGAEAMHRYLALNRDKELQIVYLVGVEGRERVSRYLRQQYKAAQENHLERNPKHALTIGWIQRGEFGADISGSDLEAISAQAREAVGYPGTISCALIQDPYIDLGASSTQYRDTHDSTLVPSLVDRYARTHGYYGYPSPSNQG